MNIEKERRPWDSASTGVQQPGEDIKHKDISLSENQSSMQFSILSRCNCKHDESSQYASHVPTCTIENDKKLRSGLGRITHKINGEICALVRSPASPAICIRLYADFPRIGAAWKGRPKTGLWVDQHTQGAEPSFSTTGDILLQGH